MPNNLVYIDVIAYFLNTKKKLYTIVFMIWNIHRDYSGKNQAKVIISIIDKYALKKTRLFH